MKVLIACEESQEVCKAFRARGHEAYSCDIQDPSGGHPEWHILGDAIKALEGGQVVTMDGVTHDVGKWDLLIAHPPCTHLAVSGARWFTEGRKPLSLRFEAAAFFMKFAEADIPLQEHSAKPDETRHRIVELLGDVPRIELFARQRVPGWDAWGDEIEEMEADT